MNIPLKGACQRHDAFPASIPAARRARKPCLAAGYIISLRTAPVFEKLNLAPLRNSAQTPTFAQYFAIAHDEKEYLGTSITCHVIALLVRRI